jgi:hypothetical protein
MTRKDYKILAESLSNNKRHLNFKTTKSVGHVVWKTIVKGLADSLNSNYANFNKDKFLDACGHE